MSLSLKESCQKYERYCRSHKDTPTFANFNAKFYTNLPSNDVVYGEFKRVLVSARRAQGLPVTRRLPSLYRQLTGEKLVAAEPAPTVQVQSVKKSFRSTKAEYDDALRANFRAPAPQKVEQSSDQWTLDAYKTAVQDSKSVLLKETNNLMVHLVPETKGASLESLACKLTKTTWESLRGKSDKPIKMRDGSTMSLETVSLDEGDLAEFVRNRKKKIAGPYFVRFSRI